MAEVHISYTPSKNCSNLDTYGVICVKCNKCGRWNTKCVNCKKEGRPNKSWGQVEFYDGWFAVCPSCKKFFTEQEVIPCRKKEFKGRRRLPVKKEADYARKM